MTSNELLGEMRRMVDVADIAVRELRKARAEKLPVHDAKARLSAAVTGLESCGKRLLDVVQHALGAP